MSRARAVGAAIVTAAALLAGCAGGTVTGTGRALNPGAAASKVVPPAGFPSTSAPPRSSAPGGTSVPGAHGVLVTYPEGHFSVVMPTQATENSQDGTLGGASFTVHYAVSVSGGNTPTEVGSEDIDQPLDPTEYQATLRAAIGAFAGASGATVNSQTATEFHGYTARRASLTSPDGRPFTLLVFQYSPVRLYIVFASDGAIYDQVTSTLRVLP